jgi:hypothetical protein
MKGLINNYFYPGKLIFEKMNDYDVYSPISNDDENKLN